MKNKPPYVKVGRRTGVSLLTGKNVRRINDGTDNFNDYWTDSSVNSSSEELGNSSSKSSGNDNVSFNDSSGDSEGPGTSVRPFLTLRTSPAHRRSPRKSALNSPYRTKCDAGTSPVIDNVARKSLGKRRKTFNSRSIQTSMKKKAYSREAEDSSPARSVSRSPKSRLILEKHLQSLPLENTLVDKSVNTSLKLRSGFQSQDTESRGLPLQIAGTSSDEEGVGSPAELTAVSSQLQIKRRLNFESPKSIRGVSKSKSLVQEKTIIHKPTGFSPASVSRKSSSTEESNVLSHITGASFDQGNSPAKSSLKSGKRFSASKSSAFEDSGMHVSVETHNEEGVERLSFKSPKLGKRVSKSSSFIQENSRVDESLNIASALQNRSFQLQNVNSSNVPSLITGAPSDQEGGRFMVKILRSGKKVSASDIIALEDSDMQDSVEAEIQENIEVLNFRSPKSQERISKSKSFGEKTITSKSRNSTPASVSLKSSLKQPNASSTNVPSHITGTPLDLERSGSRTSAKKSLKSGRGISFSKNSALEDSVMQAPNASSTNVPSHITGTLEDSVMQVSAGIQNEEDVEKLDFLIPISGRRISRSKSFVQEKTMVNRTTNSPPASVSMKSFRQNSSFTNVASHITGTSPDPDRSQSPANTRKGLNSETFSLSKSLALENSVSQAELQGHTEMQSGRDKSVRTRENRLRSFVLEKTMQDRSCNTSGVCTVQKNDSAVQNAESREKTSHSAATLVAEIEDSASRDGAEKHRDEMVPAASDDVSSNNEAVSDNENAPNAIQEKATSERPRRNRLPPLARWRNERKLFRYMPDGDVVDLGVDPGTKEDRAVIERMMKKVKTKGTNHAKTKQKIDHGGVSGSETDINLPDDTAEPAVFLDSVTGEQTEVVLQSRFKRLKWTIPTSQRSGKPAYRVCHSLWSEKVSFGFVEIAAGCKKGEQYSPDSSLHFVVMKGNLVFHMKENIYKLNTCDSISVPVATPYSIDNSGKTKALLHFCSTTMPFF